MRNRWLVLICCVLGQVAFTPSRLVAQPARAQPVQTPNKPAQTPAQAPPDPKAGQLIEWEGWSFRW
jgi:hypothetical protein